MSHDKHLTTHEIALMEITAWKGKLYAAAAEQFASRQGDLLIMRYDRLADTVQLTDGEVYTMRAIVIDNASQY